MPADSYFVLIAFIFLLFVFLLEGIRFSNVKREFLGTPTIEYLQFYSGKIAVFTTWCLFIVKAVYPKCGYIYMPDWISWIAVGLLYTGVIVMTISFINLGRSLFIGIPQHETTLQTHGLYRISRNPIYMGVHLISIASCIYFPDLINVSFTLYGIYIHHKIIKHEEHFLSERFGTEWIIYSARVSRYI
jgi:protein-S-isoprenylcysteine O-methyltransferase Ste14